MFISAIVCLFCGLLFARFVLPNHFRFRQFLFSTLVSAKPLPWHKAHQNIVYRKKRHQIIKQIDCNFIFVIKSYLLLLSLHEFKLKERKKTTAYCMHHCYGCSSFSFAPQFPFTYSSRTYRWWAKHDDNNKPSHTQSIHGHKVFRKQYHLKTSEIKM